MNERDKLFLDHVLAAIADIESFTAGGEQEFMADRETQSAVIRRLKIIGEAVKNLSAEPTALETAVA